MIKRYKLLISSLASLVLGVVFTFLFLPHFGWYLRRSTTVRLGMGVGLCVFISAIVFSFFYLINKWLNRPLPGNAGESPTTRAGQIGIALHQIQEQQPFLAKLEEATQPQKWHGLNILVLAAIPVVLALVNREWLFTVTGEDDPWRYIGLGYYYFKEPGLYSGNYKISRVPWIVVEYAIRNLFSPANAEIILGLGSIILAAVGFYLLVSRIFDRRTAFISAALLSTYSYYLVSRSVDYHNVLGSLFLVWALYFFTIAIQSEQKAWPWFLVTGLVYGVAVHSEFMVLGCLPALVIQFGMFYRGNKRSIGKAILFVLLGFLVATGLFGMAAVLSGRSFFFFTGQLDFVGVYSGNVARQGIGGTDWEWPLQSSHLALLVAVFIVSAGWLASHLVRFLRAGLAIDRSKWLQISFTLQFMLLGMAWLVGEIIKREVLLNYYFVSPLYIYAFLAFAGFLAARMEKKISPVMLGAVPLVICGTLAFSDRIFSVIGARFLPGSAIFQPLLFYLVIFACLILFKPGELATLALVVLMALGNVMGMYTGVRPIYITSPQMSLDTNQCHLREDGYLSAIETTQALWGLGWSKTHLWWDAGEIMPVTHCPQTEVNLADIGLSVTRMGIQKMKDSEPTPSLNKIPPAYYQQVVQDKDVVAVITNHPATENQMLAKLRTYGNWALTKQETIAQGDIRFSLYIFSLDGK